MISWWRYVRFEDIAAYEAAGWIVECALGAYSVFMRWTGEGDPP